MKTPHQALLVWKHEKVKIANEISSEFGELKIVLKTKDDPENLKNWIAHHARIVGFENLIIFDNTSMEQTTLDYYLEISGDVKVFSYDGFHNLIHHMDYFGELYGALRNSSNYYVFLDTDEYLVLYEGGDELISDERIKNFLSRNQKTQVFPGTWLPNLKSFNDRFELRANGWPLVGGLQWGKPIIAATSETSGIIHHNTEINHDIYRYSLKTNFFVLHRSNVVAADRIRVNLKKLISYGTLRHGDGVEQAMALDIEAMSNGNPKTYLSEIRANLADVDKPPRVTSDSFGIDRNGLIIWNHDWQRTLLTKFIEDPSEFSDGLFSVS